MKIYHISLRVLCGLITEGCVINYPATDHQPARSVEVTAGLQPSDHIDGVGLMDHGDGLVLFVKEGGEEFRSDYVETLTTLETPQEP